MNKKILSLALLASVALFSCSPDPTPTPTPTPDNSAPTPTYETGDGALVAIIARSSTSTPIGNVDVDLGTGVAVFGDLAAGTYTDAGAVKLNGSALTKNSNNSYTFMPSQTNPTGIDLSSNIKWEVQTPAVTYDAATQGRDMPSTSAKIDFSGSSINSTDAFTLKLTGSVSNADSVYFQLVGPTKAILKRMGGNVNSVTFTADEVSSVGKSVGCSITIAAWNHQLKTISGKQIHFINELALSKVIEIK